MTIGQSRFFNEKWEELQKAIGTILSEAHNDKGTMNDWVDAFGKAQAKLDNLNSFGWAVRHNKIKE